jgi:hypothetical protein
MVQILRTATARDRLIFYRFNHVIFTCPIWNMNMREVLVRVSRKMKKSR